MGKINLLSKKVSELIAAGEVIERPASIVKELLENSIDAGASAITLEIKKGGKTYLRITDNGCGMEPADVKCAFLRHATSKIKNVIELEDIKTLGFRGEALASICAVAKVEIISKTTEREFGTQAFILAGELENVRGYGAAQGTTVIVRDLFYNVPARLKFLKRDASEANAIAGIVDKIALSHPEVSIKFISDEKVKLFTSGNGQLIDAIYSVFGKEFAASLMKAEYSYNGIEVSGYISKTSQVRNNRAFQTFFVNSRYVKSATCMSALEEGYKNCILTGKFAACVLNISLAYNEVDVNVHPAKIEVRFVNERNVFDACYFAVKSSIAQNDELNEASRMNFPVQSVATPFKNEQAPQTELEEQSYQDIFGQKLQSLEKTGHLRLEGVVSPLETFASQTQTNDDLSDFLFITPESIKKTQKSVPIIHLEEPEPGEPGEMVEPEEETLETLNKKKDNFTVWGNNLVIKPIGEIFDTYFIFEVNDHVAVLDKHAAHERAIYEKLKRDISTGDRQVLLKPHVLSFTKDEFDALMLNQEQLEKLGFLFEEHGRARIILREVPLVINELDIDRVINEMAQNLAWNKRDITSITYENLLHSIACKSAIRGNDKTDIKELSELVKIIYENNEIRYCPHGRPVVYVIRKHEIDKKFKRL